jgi:2-aminoethylphosphonate-pyruvate transaminase
LEAAGVKKDEKKIMNGMKAVILAAGMGMRLKHHTNHRSKAMVSVNGTPLIDYAVNFALNGGISDINVVGGYMGKRLQRHVLKQFPDVEFVMNDNFRQGNILSLAAIFGKLKPPFVLMNVDHIYPYAIIKKLLASDGGIIAAVDFDRVLGPDDMKVKLNDDNEIVSISKQLTDFDGGYIGMTMVKEQGFDDYFEAFKQIMAKRQGNASVEEIIGHLASTENRVTICDMSGLKWLEVDTEEELFRAEETLSRNPDFFIRNFT